MPSPVEPGAEARELRERLLLGCPVEAAGPVGDQVTEVGEVRAERPAAVLGCVWPARGPQPGAQVRERPGGGPDGERLRKKRGLRHNYLTTSGVQHSARLLHQPCSRAFAGAS